MLLRDKIREAMKDWDFPCNGYNGPTDSDCDAIIEGIFKKGVKEGVEEIEGYLESTGAITEDENLRIQEINPH